MLVIDRLRLSLPPGFEHRAHDVARRVADELAASLPAAGDRHVDRLAVPAVRLTAGTDNRRLAGQVANSVHQQLLGSRGARRKGTQP